MLRSISSRLAVRTQARSFITVNCKEAFSAQQKGAGFFVDVRHPKFVHHNAPVGFTNIPHFNLATEHTAIPRNTPVYLLCDVGGLSELAAKTLESNGFSSSEIKVVDGGFLAWEYNWLPTVSQDPELQAIDKKYSGDVSFAQHKADVEALMGAPIDEDAIKYPDLVSIFGSKEEAEEAWKSLPRRQVAASKTA